MVPKSSRTLHSVCSPVNAWASVRKFPCDDVWALTPYLVGRTGAGKSTIALALLRAIPTTGSVTFDGRDISGLNLSDLRSNVTIIPQHPELLSGTLRENLDPFGEHDDATLNDVLRASGLHHTQDEEGGIGLDTDVSSGGTNLSHGQRQILALARAILRRSKLVILDEATAAIGMSSEPPDQAIANRQLCRSSD